MSDQQTPKKSSLLTRLTAGTSEIINWITFMGSTIAAVGLGAVSVFSLASQAVLLGTGLAVSTATHIMLAKSARRAQRSSQTNRTAQTMSGPRSLRHLFGSSARLAFAPVLLSFNLLSATSFAVIENIATAPQVHENASPGHGSPQKERPLGKGEVLIAHPVAKQAPTPQFSL